MNIQLMTGYPLKTGYFKNLKIMEKREREQV